MTFTESHELHFGSILCSVREISEGLDPNEGFRFTIRSLLAVAYLYRVLNSALKRSLHNCKVKYEHDLGERHNRSGDENESLSLGRKNESFFLFSFYVSLYLFICIVYCTFSTVSVYNAFFC